MLDDDITALFIQLLEEHKSVDIADTVFKRMLDDDPELREEYKEWCHSVGSSEKSGFLDYCEEYLDSERSKYDTLNDYDEDF